MKTWVKILCLVLTLAFVLPLLVACDNNKDNDDNKGGNEGVVVTPPSSIAKDTNYNNAKFTMYSVEDMFAKKYFFADKTTGDGMNDSLYQRQQNVESVLGVDLEYKAAEGAGEQQAFQVYATEVQNAIKAGDEKYQLVLSHAYYALPDLITSNSLKDLKEFESTSFTASYWNKDIMDQVSYKDHYYLGYSDFNLASTYVIAFNKTLYNSYSSAFEGNTMYDYVNNGEWTIEKLAEVASMVYEDKGEVTSNTYGLTGQLWVPFCGFIQSSGESIVTRGEDGKYAVSWQSNNTKKTKINKLTNMLQDIKAMKEVYFWLHSAFNNNVEPTQVTLDSGKAFMQFTSTNALVELKNTQVKFGVIPYPMYDEDQYTSGTEYRSLNWAGYLCVPSNITNAKMVSDVLECLSYFSDDVTTYFYEKLLGLKVSEAPEDAKMLDIIWGSLCSDFGVAYEGFGQAGEGNNLDALVYAIPHCLIQGTSFTSHNQRYGSAANRAIDNKVNK